MAVRARSATKDGSAASTDPATLQRWWHVRRAGFHIGGLTRPTDAARVSLRLRQAPGVLDVVVSPITEIAYVAYDPAETDADAIRHALDATGYGPATPWRPD